MKFSHAHILFWLWALVPAAGIMIHGIRKRRKVLARFADPDLYDRMIPGFSPVPDRIKSVLTLLGLGLIVFSLAGPQAGFRWEKTRQRGVDIMIALDCSRSMLATDVSPSRLERAKREIIDLTRLMHSDRAGLVAFSGQAVLQCPLTMDYEAFNIFLDVLTPSYLPVGGTDLAAALDACYRGFDAASDTDKAIIVITDGEDTTDRGRDALDTLVQTLAGEKVRVFAIGVGDPAGAPIPDERGGFKRDAKGEIILSRVDEKGLQKIAAATGGRYVRSVAGDMDLDQIYGQDILNTMERKTLVEGKKKVWENRFQWTLLPAVLLLLAELFVRPGKKNNRKNGNGIAVASSLLVFFCLLGTASQARADLFTSPVKQGMEAFEKKEYQKAKKLFIDAQLDNPDDPRLYYNIGAAAYAAGEYALARDNFSQALGAADRSLRQKALFNLADTRYRMGNLDGAIADYERLLKEFPDDKEAMENLDFVKKKREEEQKKEQQQKDQKKQEEKGSQKKGQDKNQDQNHQKGQDQQKKGQDPGDQDPGDQDPGDQDQQANQGAQNKTPEDQEKNQDAGASDGQAGRPDRNTAAQGEPAEGGTPAEGQPLSGEAALLESKLNRLKDTPGRALAPAGRSQQSERDW